MRWPFPALALVMLAATACTRQDDDPVIFNRQDLPASKVVSGSTFLTADSLALQADDFANPGYLWVERGADLFSTAPEAGGAACGDCHGGASDRPLAGVSATYPKMDALSGTVVNLPARINLCRTRHQDEPALDHESDELLSLTAYVANLSRGMTLNVVVTTDMQDSYDLGRAYFFTRKGQLNLACTQCHDENWGRRLRGDVISQGHPNGYPAYRLEWQSLGSLHRRFRDCDHGVGAEPMTPGSDVYTGLELYLAARAQGLTVEAPAIRR